MTLPVNIEGIIKGHTIESTRLEYKNGWNPEKILHTLTAFANDYDDIGGGYVIIGVAEDGASKIINGVSNNEIHRIEQDLFQKCNLIEPRYCPQFSVETLDEKKIIVLWAPSGESRPYRCPVHIHSEKNKDHEKGFYIRRMSHTIRADFNEEQELIRKARHISFDEEANWKADINDIRLSNIEDYLGSVGSKMLNNNHDVESYLDNMRLLVNKERKVPMNVALLMFCDDPERFFPRARIELVIKPDPAGEFMEEVVFKGPVHRQLNNALLYMKNGIIRERIYKLDGKAEALRVFNFPYDAVEEMLVNAAYHKNYSISEPITITVTPEKLEICSYPGLDPSVSKERIEKYDFRSPYNRNKRLGDFLKELKMAEGRHTGIPKILKTLERNGSPPPVYEMDEERTVLYASIPIHPRFREIDRTPEPNDGQLSKRCNADRVKSEIIALIETEGCLSTKSIRDRMSIPCSDKTLRKAINELLNEGRVRYLYPENPRDPRQRICTV